MMHIFEEKKIAPSEDTRHVQATRIINLFIVIISIITCDHYEVQIQE